MLLYWIYETFASINIFAAFLHASPRIIYYYMNLSQFLIECCISQLFIVVHTASSSFISVKRCHTIHGHVPCVKQMRFYIPSNISKSTLFFGLDTFSMQKTKHSFIYTKIIQKYRSYSTLPLLIYKIYTKKKILFSIIVQFTVPNTKFDPLFPVFTSIFN